MKVVVPCPWVVDVLGVVSCPPKGKITVGQYVASCAASEKNWATYEIVETLLELGTTKEADQVLKFSTEEDSSNEDRKFLADGSILFFFFFFFLKLKLYYWAATRFHFFKKTIFFPEPQFF